MRVGLLFAFCVVGSLVAMPAAQAETKVTISKTHLCCGQCVTIVGKTLADVKGVKHTTSQADKTITLTAESDEAAQMAIDALAKAGFYGKTDSEKVKYKDLDVTKGKVTRLELEGIHNCCGMCTTAIKKAISGVAGVKSETTKAKETSLVVEGDFVATDVVKALLDIGFYMHVKK